MPDASAPARRQRLFFVLALLLPVLALGALEAGLRLFRYKGDLALFVRLPILEGRYAGVNKRFAGRYFVNVQALPTSSNDLFLVDKPADGFRLFVLGESTTNGFPYGYNGTFSRVVQDALRDVMPDRTVEVVNLGVAATTTYTLVDEVREILAQRPDGILVYAGHNEFYGALGAASTERAGASPRMVRTFLWMQRFRTVLLARELAARVTRTMAGRTPAGSSGPLMQQLVREEAIPLQGDTYARGRIQFRDNLSALLARFREAGVPVFIASLTSNLRDQPPFRSVATPTGLPRADSVYASAQRALAAGQVAEARARFAEARDLDGLRFRATAEWNTIIQSLATEHGAHYVPVDEAFAAASPDGIPGATLFWEHLHPNQAGYLLMGRVFFEALAREQFLGRTADLTRLHPWAHYQERMALSEFDRQFAHHEIQSLVSRWPFVAAPAPAPYGEGYRPMSAADSLAFAATIGGMGWPRGKLLLAEQYRARGALPAALAELRGLRREQPVTASLFLMAAEIHLQLQQPDSARGLLEHAHALEPTAASSFALATVELAAKNFPRAIALLEETLRRRPDDPAAMLNLAYAYIITRQPARARPLAERLGQQHPGFPGVTQLRALFTNGTGRPPLPR